MNNFNMKTLVLGMIQTNCYIISNTQSKEAIVIDPAAEAVKIIDYLKTNNLICKAILLTHGHFDHILAAKELSELTEAKIHAHEAEAKLLSDPALNASSLMGRATSLTADVLLKDQEILTIAGFILKVIHTPGHTAGGVCYYFEEQGCLISGDTLFRESVGRTDFPTGDGQLLIESILNKLMLLEDKTLIYPGHGMSTTVGYEKENNFYLIRD
ncbi:MBL fold metallo-hydrolase [Mobilitalea sibirica]|uniref:MBL fold metallo-hydrolase n=1 Tax=Mobilitalea sibirica TaxID=1462919 RepID=A0A8J7HB27_9FIRM|nr:MBL fold metallo-hydrolase [Mobilitalea sibirica]MBH1939532.1 MBL fold metallo-hydrolase [Mobilitalea sibirica]